MFSRFIKNTLEVEINVIPNALLKELEQEEYNIKWEIYALTKNLDVMGMTLDRALRYKMHEDLKYTDYKESKYDLTSGYPKNRSEVNLVNLFFQFECLNRENQIDEVINCIESMAAFYDDKNFATYLSCNYMLQGLNKKPCNQNLTALMSSIGSWTNKLAY
jgi:hypothetical protein